MSRTWEYVLRNLRELLRNCIRDRVAGDVQQRTSAYHGRVGTPHGGCGFRTRKVATRSDMLHPLTFSFMLNFRRRHPGGDLSTAWPYGSLTANRLYTTRTYSVHVAFCDSRDGPAALTVRTALCPLSHTSRLLWLNSNQHLRTMHPSLQRGSPQSLCLRHDDHQHWSGLETGHRIGRYGGSSSALVTVLVEPLLQSAREARCISTARFRFRFVP
jgi:hypothetical protein